MEYGKIDNTKRILGIDQSFTSTGCVIKEDDHTIYMERIKTDPKESKYSRAITVSDRIINIITEHDIHHVNIEGLSFGSNTNATRDLAGLLYVIVTRCMIETYLEPTILAPTQVKKFATGRGNAKKDEMFAALPDNIKERIMNMGVKKTTGMYDICDAYWIANYEVIA